MLIAATIPSILGFALFSIKMINAWKEEISAEKKTFLRKLDLYLSAFKVAVFVAISGASAFLIMALSAYLMISNDCSTDLIYCYTISMFVFSISSISMMINLGRMDEIKLFVKEFGGEHIEKQDTDFFDYLFIYVLPESVNLQFIFGFYFFLYPILEYAKTYGDFSLSYSEFILKIAVIGILLTVPLIWAMEQSSKIPMNRVNFSRKSELVGLGCLPPFLYLTGESFIFILVTGLAPMEYALFPPM